MPLAENINSQEGELMRLKRNAELEDAEKIGLAAYIIDLKLFDIRVIDGKFFIAPDLADALRRLVLIFDFKQEKTDTKITLFDVNSFENIADDFTAFLKNNFDILLFGNQNIDLEIQRFSLSEKSENRFFIEVKNIIENYINYQGFSLDFMNPVFLFMANKTRYIFNNPSRKITLGDIREALLFIMRNSNIADDKICDQFAEWISTRTDKLTLFGHNIDFQTIRKDYLRNKAEDAFIDYLNLAYKVKNTLFFNYRNSIPDIKNPYRNIEKKIVNMSKDPEERGLYFVSVRKYMQYRFKIFDNEEYNELFTKLRIRYFKFVQENPNYSEREFSATQQREEKTKNKKYREEISLKYLQDKAALTQNTNLQPDNKNNHLSSEERDNIEHENIRKKKERENEIRAANRERFKERINTSFIKPALQLHDRVNSSRQAFIQTAQDAQRRISQIKISNSKRINLIEEDQKESKPDDEKSEYKTTANKQKPIPLESYDQITKQTYKTKPDVQTTSTKESSYNLSLSFSIITFPQVKLPVFKYHFRHHAESEKRTILHNTHTETVNTTTAISLEKPAKKAETLNPLQQLADLRGGGLFTKNEECDSNNDVKLESNSAAKLNPTETIRTKAEQGSEAPEYSERPLPSYKKTPQAVRNETREQKQTSEPKNRVSKLDKFLHKSFSAEAKESFDPMQKFLRQA